MNDAPLPAAHRILLVDDNRSIHDDYRKIFRPPSDSALALQRGEVALFDDPPALAATWEIEIDFALQGEEALEMVRAARASGRPYEMAFIDMRMPPGWNGLETTLQLWKVCPDLQVVICTAYSDCSWEEMSARFGRTDRVVFLRKPFDSIEILQLAQALTEKWRLLQLARAKEEELEARVAERTRDLQTAHAKLEAEVASRIEVEEALRQSQKMEAVGQLAGGIAHDFNNLLSVIRGHTGLLLAARQLPPAKVEESLREVDGAAERAASLTRQLLTFSRKQMLQPEDLDLNDVVGQVNKLLHRLLGENIILELQAGVSLPFIHGDRAMIEQVIVNLAVNARDAMDGGGRVLVRTSSVEFTAEAPSRHPLAQPGRFVSLAVSDTGRGIAPEIMPRLFEPFFTTKEVGKGTGLGLATAYGIVKQHGGWLEVESVLGVGTTFTVFLPARAPLAAEAPRHSWVPEAVGGTETILLVEDEAPLLNVTRMVLQCYGYKVHGVRSAVEALKIWPEYGAQIDLLLTDVVMPEGISGPELASRLKIENPSLRVIYCSGYSRDLVGRDGILEPGMHFLSKPYTPVKLAQMVRDCLDGRGPGAAATVA